LATVKLADCRRVILFDYNPDTQQIEFRHYSINVKLTGVSKSIKNLISANLNDLEKFDDVSEYVLKASLLSESDVEDAGESTVTLADKYIGKGNSKSEERAIRLAELGPRMVLSINKIVSGLMSEDVLYHSYISKTKEEIKELEIARKKRESIKAKRRAVQEANVKAKEKKNEEKSQKQTVGSEDEDYHESEEDFSDKSEEQEDDDGSFESSDGEDIEEKSDN
jgi:ribosome biogenesis protein SSF1/2